MNILQISNKALFPPDGGSLAILNLANAYARLNHNVTLLNMVTHKHYNKDSDIRVLKERNIELIGIEVNTKISVLKLLLNFFFTKRPYTLERFINQNFSNRLISLIVQKKWDFIQIEGLYVLFYIDIIREYYPGKIIYRPHNIESEIWFENAKNTRSILKKIYFTVLANRLKKFELKYINSYDVLLPISNTDAHFYTGNGNIKPMLTTPFGVEIGQFDSFYSQVSKPENSPTILYIGALDWIPNQQGLIWFIKNCFPLIISQVSNVELLIAGRNAPKWFVKRLSSNNNIRFVGQIENACDFFSIPGPMIVPLFSGSGMRVKIIEAMAFKKAIVSTPKGAEGIDKLNEEKILISNNPHSFAENVLKLLENRDLRNSIGNTAHDFVLNEYNIETIASKAIQFINQH